MVDFLTMATMIVSGLAALSNVILVSKRYKKLKNDVDEIESIMKEMNTVNTLLRGANETLSEARIKNNGKSPLSKDQKEELEKLLKEINVQMDEVTKQKV